MSVVSRIAGGKHRHQGSRLVTWLVAAAIVITSHAACAVVNLIEKVGKTPGLEEAQLREHLEKKPGRVGQHGPSSPLQATPARIDFGGVPVASKTAQTVTIVNPFGFPVTVIRVSVEGCDFAIAGEAAERATIPAHGELVYTVTFQPAQRRTCSGLLLLEIDSAGGRFTRVPVKGRGI